MLKGIKIVGNGEISHNQYFVLFQTIFAPFKRQINIMGIKLNSSSANTFNLVMSKIWLCCKEVNSFSGNYKSLNILVIKTKERIVPK